MPIKLSISVGVFIIGLTLQQPVFAETLLLDSICITVNSQIATQSEVTEAMEGLRQQILQGMPPGKEQTEQLAKLRQTIIEEKIADFLLIDRAKSLKVEVEEELIDGRIEDLKQENPQVFKAYSQFELRDQISKEMMKQRVIGQEVDSKIHIDTPEIIQWCEQNNIQQRKLAVSQILFRSVAPPSIDRIQIIRDALKAGTPFAVLAKRYSDDPASANNGGKLGVFESGQLLPEIDQVVFTLKPKEMSALVHTRYGYHLLYVEEEQLLLKQDCQHLPAALETQYTDQLYVQKKQKAIALYLEKLRQSAQVEVQCLQP